MAGPDYGAFKNGWWSLQENLVNMREKMKLLEKLK